MTIISKKPDTPEILNCEKHGRYEARYTEWLDGKFMASTVCNDCINERAKEKKEKDEARQKIEDQHRLQKLKAKSGLRQRHINCSFDNYEAATTGQGKALDSVTTYTDLILTGHGNCLIMAGQVGTGKTHLAAAMINKFIECKRSCLLIKMPELIRCIKSSWSRSSDTTESELIKTYSLVSLLIIDEIGVQYGSDAEKLLLSEIIDNRYQEMLPTVLISNLDANGIKSCIGSRSFDRLREDGGKLVAFDWDSARGAA